jgi:amidase
MASGKLTSFRLTLEYIARIAALDQSRHGVNAVIELNPDALSMALNADNLRRQGKVLGPLHGIPVLIKDNIDTGDKMQTSAGSFALVGRPAPHDSTVAANLRAGGAVILGKTNLSEWANFRSTHSTSGWSGRGGLTHNPYSLDRNACGSSSGSGAAAAANFAAISYGSETDGSIVCPASVNGVVGFKPTIGLVSRAGVVPISHTQDTVGPHGRTLADAVLALNAIVSRAPDPRDPATGGVPLGWQACSPACNGTPLPGKNRPALPADYSAFLSPNGLSGARLGLTRQGIQSAPPQVVAAFNAAVDAIKNAGAIVVDLDDPANNFNFSPADGEFLVLEYDLKIDLTSYFHTRVGVPVAGGNLQRPARLNVRNRVHARRTGTVDEPALRVRPVARQRQNAAVVVREWSIVTARDAEMNQADRLLGGPAARPRHAGHAEGPVGAGPASGPLGHRPVHKLAQPIHLVGGCRPASSQARTWSATALSRSSLIRSRYTLAMSPRECPMM